MPMDNATIAERLEHLADLLEIQGANPFRVRAYRNAARTILSVGRPIPELVAEGENLDELPFVGEDLAGKIEELATTGELGMIRELESQLPGELASMLTLPGLGPKRIDRLHRELGVDNLTELEQMARQGRIAELRGFGTKLQSQILAGLDERKAGGESRVDWATADRVARALLIWLEGVPGLDQITVAGSYRRRRDTVGDLDVLVTATDPSAVMDRFVGWDRVASVVAHGATRSAVNLYDGIHVDVRVVGATSYGAALHYFTGSKAHNIAIRRRGMARGLKLNEYGIFRGEERVGGSTEHEVFAAVGLPFIPPELREDRGEIEAAEQGRLPELVAIDDVRGDLRVRPDVQKPEGLLALVEGARALGWSYVGLSPRVATRGGAGLVGAAQLGAWLDRVDSIRDVAGIKVLAGAEIEITEDGDIDLEDELLERLDIVIGAIHRGDGPTRLTEQLERAIGTGRLRILAHPGGRILGERVGFGFDFARVVRTAIDAGCALEIDGDPRRMDLDDVHARTARDLGARFALSGAPGSVSELARVHLAVGQARRGWLDASTIVNTWSWRELDRWLRDRAR